MAQKVAAKQIVFASSDKYPPWQADARSLTNTFYLIYDVECVKISQILFYM